MLVDFYQCGGTPVHEVVAQLAGKVVETGERLLVVMADENALARLDRLLWDEEGPRFLAHGIAGSSDDSRQPILLSTTPDAANGARNILLGDGEWREAALSYDRAFHLFDEDSLAAARLAWKLLAGREGVERRYWAREDGRWANKG